MSIHEKMPSLHVHARHASESKGKITCLGSSARAQIDNFLKYFSLHLL